MSTIIVGKKENVNLIVLETEKIISDKLNKQYPFCNKLL